MLVSICVSCVHAHILGPCHGGCSRPGPNPKGGGGGALLTPKWLYRTMGFVGAGGAGDFFLGIRQGENFLFDPMSTFKILRILWRIQKWMYNTEKDFDPDPTSGSDLD